MLGILIDEFSCSRQDFLVIPFQAVEVYLDSVVPSESKFEYLTRLSLFFIRL